MTELGPDRHLAVLGLSHQGATLAMREAIQANLEQALAVATGLRASGFLGGIVPLVTCNRLEVYFSADDASAATIALQTALTQGCDPSQLAAIEWTAAADTAAVHHLFRVAASLDSLVLGDSEILGQLRRAYAAALAAGTVDGVLNLAFQAALRVGKGVRTHTAIQQRAGSVASLIAQQLRARERTGPIVILGAGEIAQSLLRLLKKHPEPCVVLNRSAQRLDELAQEFAFTPGRLEELAQYLPAASALVSCLALDRPLVTPDVVRPALEARASRLDCFDLGVPRTIDPAVGALPGVRLVDLESLQRIVEANESGRAAAAAAAEAWVAREVDDFLLAWALRPLAPALAAIRGRKNAPPPELASLLEPYVATLDSRARRHLSRKLGPAAHALPPHLQAALSGG